MYKYTINSKTAEHFHPGTKNTFQSPNASKNVLAST